MQSYNTEIMEKLEHICEAAGLRFFGVVTLAPEQDFPRFVSWLEKKAHAGMRYLEKYQNCRADPRELLEGAKTAIIIGLGYFQGDRYAPGKKLHDSPRIAQYARLVDYHKILWQRGAVVHDELLSLLGEKEDQHTSRVVADSAPLLERALAAKGGRGFIGKNTCFIDADAGSYFLLGEIITTLPLAIEKPELVDPMARTERGGCGTCKRCQVHCPTGALSEDYILDANKCLAYWTIENRDVIPERFWPWLRHYVFGCDICQLVCPYNRGAVPAAVQGLVKVPQTPPLFEVATMTHLDYERFFSGTPLTRAKREGLIRNALIAMCVAEDVRLDEALKLVAEHERAPMLVRTLEQISAWRLRPSPHINP